MATDVGRTRTGRAPAGARTRRRGLTTETKPAFKTTEFMAYVGVLVTMLIAAAIVDESNAGGFGANQAWLYAVILTGAYLISRGLAKSGSYEPEAAYADPEDRRERFDRP